MVVNVAGVQRPVKQAEGSPHACPVSTVHRNHMFRLPCILWKQHMLCTGEERICVRHRLLAYHCGTLSDAHKHTVERQRCAQRIAVRRRMGNHRKIIVFLYERSNAAQRVLSHAARSFFERFMHFTRMFSVPVRPAVLFYPC